MNGVHYANFGGGVMMDLESRVNSFSEYLALKSFSCIPLTLIFMPLLYTNYLLYRYNRFYGRF